MLGPQPRQRLYTSLSAYGKFAGDLVSGRVRQGASVAELERRFANQVGAVHAVAAPLARTALYFVLRALIREGQAVVLSPYTISDVVNMVLCAGGRPVFADIEPDSCNISAAEVERLVEDNTGAVLVTHFHGLASDIERIRGFCQRRGVPLIEDCAQALGTKVAGRHVGTFGDAGIFSFGLFKCVTSFLGGMVVTDNAQLAEEVRRQTADLAFERPGALAGRAAHAAAIDLATSPPLFGALTFPMFRWARMHGHGSLERQFAFDHNPAAKDHIPERYLHRMTPAQARLVLRQLDTVDAHAAERIRKAEMYYEGLRTVPQVRLPPRRTDGSHTYQYYPIQIPDREAFVTYALSHGRDLAVSHHRNCAAMECFAPYGSDCPNAARSERETVYLPTYPAYADREVRSNIELLHRFFGRQH